MMKRRKRSGKKSVDKNEKQKKRINLTHDESNSIKSAILAKYLLNKQ